MPLMDANHQPRAGGKPGFWRRLGPAKWLALLTLATPSTMGMAMISAAPWLGPWLRESPTGPLVYLAGFLALGGAGVLPTYTQSALGGFAFGFPLGLACATLGFLGAAAIGYAIARRASGDRVMQMLDDHPRLRAVRDALVGQRRPAMADSDRPRCRLRAFWRTTFLVALVRLMPQSPFAFTNVVMASLQVPRGPFILGTLVGLLPRSALFVLIGSTADQLTRESIDHAIPLWVKLGGVAATFALIALVGTLARHAVLRAGADARSQDQRASHAA